MKAGIRKDILSQLSAGKECQELLLEADQSYERSYLGVEKGRRELFSTNLSQSDMGVMGVPTWE